MKKLLPFLLLLLVSPVFAQKQKVDFDNDTIFVNKAPYATLIKSAGTTGSDLSLRTLDGKEQIFFKFLEYSHPSKANSGNPTGRIIYFEVTFFNDGQKCEIRHYASKKKLAEFIVENGLISGNTVDAEAEKRFVMVNGKTFSAERDRLMAPDVIIINTGH